MPKAVAVSADVMPICGGWSGGVEWSGAGGACGRGWVGGWVGSTQIAKPEYAC